MLMKKKNPSPSLPFFATQSLGQYSHPLLCSHSPSKFPDIHFPRRSNPWKCFLTSKGPKLMEYPYLKIIIPIIACSWKSMDTIGYQCPTTTLFLNSFTNILLHVPIIFSADATTNFLELVPTTQTRHFHASCTKHIIAIRIKGIEINSKHVSLVAHQ